MYCGQTFPLSKQNLKSVHWSDDRYQLSPQIDQLFEKSASDQLRNYISSFSYTSGVKTDVDSLDLQADSLTSRIGASALPYVTFLRDRDLHGPVSHEFPGEEEQICGYQSCSESQRYFQIDESPFEDPSIMTDNYENNLWLSSDLPMRTRRRSIDEAPDDVDIESSCSSISIELPSREPWSRSDQKSRQIDLTIPPIDVASPVSSPSSVELREFTNMLQTRLQEQGGGTLQVQPKPSDAPNKITQRRPAFNPVVPKTVDLDPTTLELCRPLIEGTSSGPSHGTPFNRLLSATEKSNLRSKLDSMSRLNDWKEVVNGDVYHRLLGPPLVSPAHIGSTLRQMRADDHQAFTPSQSVFKSSILTSNDSDTLRYLSTEKLERLIQSTRHIVKNNYKS